MLTISRREIFATFATAATAGLLRGGEGESLAIPR